MADVILADEPERKPLGGGPGTDGGPGGDEQSEEKRVVRCSDGRLRLCKARSTGWTARRRGLFIDCLTATSNVREAARAARMSVRSAYALRARDPQFAAEWDEALATAEARLIGKLVVYAETRGARSEGVDADDDLSGFNPVVALEAIRLHQARRDKGAGRRPRGGPMPRTASREETEAAVRKVLQKLAKRLRSKA